MKNKTPEGFKDWDDWMSYLMNTWTYVEDETIHSRPGYNTIETTFQELEPNSYENFGLRADVVLTFYKEWYKAYLDEDVEKLSELEEFRNQHRASLP